MEHGMNCERVAKSIALLALAGMTAGCARGPDEAQKSETRTESPVRPDVLETMRRALTGARDAQSLRDAVETLKRLPSSPSVDANLGIAYAALGEHAQAEKALREAAAANGTDPRSLEFLARIFMGRQTWDKARRELRRAQERSPGNPRILTTLGVVETHLDNTRAAGAMFRNALAEAPDYAPACYNMARLHEIGLGDRTEAARWYRRYLDLVDPEEAPSADTETPPQRCVAKAEAFLAALPPAAPPPEPAYASPAPATPPPEQEPGPQTVPAQAEATEPSEPEDATAPAAPGPAAALIRRAEAAIDNKAFDEALVILKKAVEEAPKDPDGSWALAVLYDRHLGYAEQAADTYADFAERFPADPRHAAARERLARLRPPASTQEPPPAEPADPEPYQAWFEKGLQQYRAGEWDLAIASYRKALQHKRDDAVTWYNLGFAYKAKGDVEKARAAFETATRYGPDLLQAQYMVAVMYRKSGKHLEAIELLRIVLRSRPDYAKAHLLLGLSLREVNRSDLAEEHLKRYVELEPDGPAAEDVKRWLAQPSEPDDTR